MKRHWISGAMLVTGLLALAAWAQDKADNEPQPMTDVRTWTDVSGAFTQEAAMVKFANGKVHLQKPDGKVTSVPIEKLSKEDQKFVRSELAKLRKTGRSGRSSGSTTAPLASGGGNWPGWLGPERDGKSPDTGLLKQWPEGGPPLLWKATGIGRGYSSVTVVDGVVYITGTLGETETLTALDLQGQQQWQIPHGPAHGRDYPGTRSSVTYDQGNLYLLSGNGKVGCYEASNGKPKWACELTQFGGEVPGWAYAESVLIYKDLAIVTPGGDPCIVALDKKNGQPAWSSNGFRAAPNTVPASRSSMAARK